MSSNRLFRLLKDAKLPPDPPPADKPEDKPTVDPEDTIIQPPPGTVTVKRRDLGLKEINTGQYYLSDEAAEDVFRVLPERESPLTAISSIWRIELGIEGLGVPPLRLEIRGPVVIGRGEEADLNLSDYDALHFGISRRHVMLRPSSRALYFIELGSSNGSRVNGVDIRPDVALTLNLGDVIRLGTMTLVIRQFRRVGP